MAGDDESVSLAILTNICRCTWRDSSPLLFSDVRLILADIVRLDARFLKCKIHVTARRSQAVGRLSGKIKIAARNGGPQIGRLSGKIKIAARFLLLSSPILWYNAYRNDME
jgi:hypothetical protein